jgi:hypothetical protein
VPIQITITIFSHPVGAVVYEEIRQVKGVRDTLPVLVPTFCITLHKADGINSAGVFIFLCYAIDPFLKITNGTD